MVGGDAEQRMLERYEELSKKKKYIWTRFKLKKWFAIPFIYLIFTLIFLNLILNYLKLLDIHIDY